MIFETDRLAIRKFNYKDLELFYDMVGNQDVMKYIKPALSYEESNNELKRFIRFYNYPQKEYFIWAVTSKKDKELVGLCGYYLNNKNEYEIAYRLRKTFWGKGFGLELAEGLIDYIKQSLNLKRVVAYVSVKNNASIKILNKVMCMDKNKNPPQENDEYKYILF